MKQATFLVCAFLVFFQLYSTSYAAPAADTSAAGDNVDNTAGDTDTDYTAIAKKTADGTWDDDGTYHSAASTKTSVQNWFDDAGNAMKEKMGEATANVLSHLMFRDN